MKLPLQVLRNRSPLEIQMTPLIDVVFLLLVFFVWTAGGRIAEKWLPSSVSTQSPPSASDGATNDEPPPPPEADFERIVVRVVRTDAGLLWSVNQTPVASLDAAGKQLVDIARINADVPVVLHPDGEVPLHAVVAAYDVARRAGFAKVSMAAAWKPATNSPAGDATGGGS